MQPTILLTGATGFVGGAILKRLNFESKFPVVVAVRDESRVCVPNVPKVCIETFDDMTKWEAHLAGCGVVIHSAARVHVMQDVEVDPLAAFRKVNVDGTLNLARQAAAAGVRRFIFISSIKVNGEGTDEGSMYSAEDVPAPVDPYGISKMEAEEGLRQLAKATTMEIVIIRPVLVYGPGVKANFLSMMRWLDRGIPLPFGAIHNSRSLVALGNLVDLILTCIDHPAAANQTFLVSDGEDLSTTVLLSKMAKALNKPARLVPVPAWVLRSGAALLGKKALSQRLCGSLRVDISKTRDLLGWAPPLSVDEALAITAMHFREHQ
ncbi:SDR family oxidoreductase [Pseudomonas sp. C1C7]|uniref:UDP-glucose 4-epimerase family protein n=1 Tax=Pseudomonas sp. C1C7 TaxID=2735272 RepID=UPI001586EC3B|nr:SDR family oxidoreductase [Pseudomonas sp. C1C7]NUT76983.1 SDR family oxidoreductase [Pseudomonas sp. C1C7]